MTYIVKSLLYYNMLYSVQHVLTFETHHQRFELTEMKTIDWDEYYSAALLDAHEDNF
jgi:hypothetical protein